MTNSQRNSDKKKEIKLIPFQILYFQIEAESLSISANDSQTKGRTK